MLDRISLTCFVASYAVALLLEASRLFFRSGVRGAVMLGFGGAGVIAHTMFLVNRAATSAHTPLSSEFDWYLIAAWVLAVVYLYLTFYHPRTSFGLFVLPLVLGLIGMANLFAGRQPFAEKQAEYIWGAIHGGFLLVGLVASAVGFVGGLMGLVQAYRLKHKIPPQQRLRLPSLEWLEHTNSRAVAVSVVMLGIGVLSGVVLNIVNHRLQQVGQVPWDDPIVWSSGLLAVWLVVAGVFSVVYRPARQGRKVAYLAITSFLVLMFTLGVQMVSHSKHGAAPPPATSGPSGGTP